MDRFVCMNAPMMRFTTMPGSRGCLLVSYMPLAKLAWVLLDSFQSRP